ncbi:GMC oxidoreductase-domain-containing protein [Lophiotrema nucula]|uniref:GMC oxidoreductase-domain-containing protein n=1 Tax=Lophiotrema nucula TaxID=690887 RepID=A0A6A5ZPS8_9PLEO|nr:GMC oxidoreductase-domain-containing protein [Lophiotrema nucula]
MSTFEPGREYDIVFAGGGTAACVTAGRLSAADPSLSILIIERGHNNLDDPAITTPALFFTNYAPTSQYTLFYQAKSEPSLDGRARIISTGGVLGGGSSINAMMYSRAQGADFDNFKVEGWGKEDLIPLAKKLETFTVNEPGINKAVHGSSGPIHISMGPHDLKEPQQDFLAAAESVGIPVVNDLQNFEGIGMSTSAKYISPEGKRQDAAHQYIHPLIADGKHPNLHLLLETRVRRVVFSGTQAVGVEFEPEASLAPEDSDKAPKTVQAKKLVVVSSGTLSSPSILERSGIGAADLLRSLDIPVVSNIPGVGENYQDHHSLFIPYKTTLTAEQTLDCVARGELDIPQAFQDKNTILGWNSVDIVGKWRMTPEEVASLGPEFKEAYERDYENNPTKPVMLLGSIAALLSGPNTLVNEEEKNEDIETAEAIEAKDKKSPRFTSLGLYTPYPYSRGSIHITSQDASAPPKLITGFLSDEHGLDVKKLVWGYKKIRDVYRRTNAYAGELAVVHPKFKAGSKAAFAKGPLRKNGFGSVQDRQEIPPLEYDSDDDRAIEEYVRERVETTWHSLGTCKMGANEKGGVVDKDLNVYGTEGLKVVDLSVIPENVGANTYNTALIVGEKAAVIIGKELGLTV